ncbi:MAG: CocE/NonD family hydrolase [Gemmatimonadetes bacterium]|nr:CocE/NonD family hydrolase [Gemmatimonadota bacterium]
MVPVALASLAVSTLVSLQAAPRAATAQESEGNDGLYEVVLFKENVMVPMRDGVRLATDIYRPARNGQPVDGKFPLLNHRTGYNKKSERFVEQAQYFARHGYVVALQDDRGTYASEGTQTKYIGFGKDGYDAIEWLATNLPYVDGQVGMWGTSYGAHTQGTAAILNPSHLKTLVLNMGGVYNGWHHKIRNHGAFELGQQIGWAFSQMAAQTYNPVAKEMMKHEKASDWITSFSGKLGLTPLASAPNFEEYIYDMMTRGDYDDYWKQPDVNWSLHYQQTADIPMLHITGWYDSYTAGTIYNYSGLSKLKKSPQRLLVGPWLHGGNTRSSSGNVEFGAEAAIPDFPDAFHVRWFDHFLKGDKNGVEDEPPVRLFVMGTGDGHKDEKGRLFHGGYWLSAKDWPLPGTRLTTYYFHGDGSLRPEKPAPNVAPTTYAYDPRQPVPTIGGSFSGQNALVAAGAFDQREREFTGDEENGFYGSRPPYLPLRARPDVIVFQTEPLAQDVIVIGPIVVKLYASSSAVDTDFTAKLVDVYPPSPHYPSGYDMNLTDGILRARYRNSPEKPELMTPGQVYEFTVEPFPTANVFKKGHRIRIDISSSNFPRFDVNPNTGEPLGKSHRFVTADNSVYHDASRASHAILPIVPAEAAGYSTTR